MTRTAIAAVGALIAVISFAAGTTPQPLFDALDGNSVVAVVAFFALLVAGRWVLLNVPPRVWAWALPLGVLFAIADLAAISLLSEDADLSLFEPSLWGAVHVLGTAYSAAVGVAAILHGVDRLKEQDPHAFAGVRKPGPLERLVADLRGDDAGRRRRAIGITFGVIVLSRIPYWVLWWPGLIFFDTYRSITHALGTYEWSTYEPVGHSLLVVGWYHLTEILQLSDAGGLALAAAGEIVATSAAFTFLLVRMARWWSGYRLWGAALAWIALVPVLALSSITFVKDVPFTAAYIVFLTAIAEIAFGLRKGAVPRWAWITLGCAAFAVAVLRNNGVYVVVLGLLLLFLPFRRAWRRLAVTVGAVFAALGLFVGPVYAALGVQPGPNTEAWSVPLQQVARIALDHHDEMSQEDRAFVNRIFTSWQVDDVGDHYIPGLSDPIKLDARAKWDDLGTAEFLSGWSRLVARYPVSAVNATLANTVGYWGPGAPAYDGVFQVSWNDVRGITLDIPSEEPTEGLRGYIHRHDLLGDGLRAVPVIGQVMSPGTITWLWILAAAVLARKRAWMELAFMLPALVQMATFLAGPVSGGMRYSLGFYATLPLAIGVALVARGGGSAQGNGRPGTAPAVNAKGATRVRP